MSFFEFPHTRTYDSDLGWLIKDYKTLDELIAAIKNWIQETQPTIDDLVRLYQQLEAGNLPPATFEQLRIWINQNTVDIIGSAIKTVHFDLTTDGYLRAIIPDSWSDLIFGTTGLDIFPVGVDFGHLTLTY